MSVSVQPSAALPAVEQRQVISAAAASCMGLALYLFNLSVLLNVAPPIGRVFFPPEDAMLSLAAVYASSALTLLMGPLGSASFGSYRDRQGQKGAVVGVGLSTVAFGLLPTFAQVELVAPILFMLLRLVQGVFVSGVVASTQTIGTESVAPKYRGAVPETLGKLNNGAPREPA
jgi:MHS family proline/betaine transporter-like MFS transporter